MSHSRISTNSLEKTLPQQALQHQEVPTAGATTNDNTATRTKKMAQLILETAPATTTLSPEEERLADYIAQLIVTSINMQQLRNALSVANADQTVVERLVQKVTKIMHLVDILQHVETRPFNTMPLSDGWTQEKHDELAKAYCFRFTRTQKEQPPETCRVLVKLEAFCDLQMELNMNNANNGITEELKGIKCPFSHREFAVLIDCLIDKRVRAHHDSPLARWAAQGEKVLEKRRASVHSLFVRYLDDADFRRRVDLRERATLIQNKGDFVEVNLFQTLFCITDELQVRCNLDERRCKDWQTPEEIRRQIRERAEADHTPAEARLLEKLGRRMAHASRKIFQDVYSSASSHARDFFASFPDSLDEQVAFITGSATTAPSPALTKKKTSTATVASVKKAPPAKPSTAIVAAAEPAKQALPADTSTAIAVPTEPQDPFMAAVAGYQDIKALPFQALSRVFAQWESASTPTLVRAIDGYGHLKTDEACMLERASHLMTKGAAAILFSNPALIPSFARREVGRDGRVSYICPAVLHRGTSTDGEIVRKGTLVFGYDEKERVLYHSYLDLGEQRLQATKKKKKKGAKGKGRRRAPTRASQERNINWKKRAERARAAIKGWHPVGSPRTDIGKLPPIMYESKCLVFGSDNIGWRLILPRNT